MHDERKCLFCNAPATRLCDAVIGFPSAGWYKPVKGAPYRHVSEESMLATQFTCDAPFCAAHGHVIGFVCGDDPDTIDHCTGCYAAKRGGGGGIMEPGQIETLRRQWHAAYRRGRINPLQT